jgi:tRNA 2-selenouridine synthase
MPITRLSISEFLKLSKNHPVLDVRSPGEYRHAHIPEAYSLPLFTDEERKVVGTAYKQESREKAIKIGLSYFGNKMVSMVEEVEKLITDQNQANSANSKSVLVHCWRGGMRSAGVAWLLDLYGFTVYTLSGGYKAYRNWVLKQFENTYNICVLGGYTGSGKTQLLQQLSTQGETIIDLEKLAGHKGSAFGNLEKGTQPGQEMFENELAKALAATDTGTIWVEDESQRIGLVNIPGHFMQTLRESKLLFIDIPFEDRLQYILAEYGNSSHESLEAAITRIKKRLGGLNTKNAIEYLKENNLRECFRILLAYYDKLYRKALDENTGSQRQIIKIESHSVDPVQNALLLLPQQIA